MAFESLTDKLQNVFKNLRKKGRLTEADVKAALKEVKMALLEADVSFKVVKQFMKSVQERAVGADVMSGLNPGQMVKLVDDLREEFDYVLLDCPAGIEQGFQNAIAGADRALVVTTPEVSAIRDADRIIGLLEASGMKTIDLVVNRIRMDMVRRGDMMSLDDVMDILAIDIIGAVPDDEDIVISTNQGEPLVGIGTPAGQAYMDICKRITGETVPLLNMAARGGFFFKLSNLLKRA